MLKLDNFRIIQLDKLNLTFDEFREVENLKTKEKSMKWVRAGGYYGNLESCLKAIKDYIVSSEIGKNNNLDLLKFLDELNGSYVKCNLKACEENE